MEIFENNDISDISSIQMKCFLIIFHYFFYKLKVKFNYYLNGINFREHLISRIGKINRLRGDLISRIGKINRLRGDLISRIGKINRLRGDLISRIGKINRLRGDLISRIRPEFKLI